MAKEIILWSIPRTGCHLLERILSKQSNVSYQLHPFAATRPPQRQLLNAVSDYMKDGHIEGDTIDYDNALQTAIRDWIDAAETSKTKGKILFSHEHPFMALRSDQLLRDTTNLSDIVNPIAFPEETLLAEGVVPIFTIRHPILQARSVLKAIDHITARSSRAEILVTSDWGWSHALYDWYLAHGVAPVIVDADDFMTSETFAKQLCQKIGLNPEEAVFQWPKTEQHVQDAMHPMLKKVQDVLINSEGLDPSHAAKHIDLAAEKAKWAEDLDGKQLEILEELYARAMPQWEYLYLRRFVGVGEEGQ